MAYIAGSPYGTGTPTFGQQPFFYPFASQAVGSYGAGALQPLQQVQQLLQIIPQHLQQLQALEQQQILLLQQLPAQLQQLQQLIQLLPQQLLSLQQQWQPFGQGVSGTFGVGLGPQPFGGPGTSHVM